MTDRSLLLVDFSNQVYKATAAHPTLSFAGKFTGGVWGVLTALCKIANEVEATHMVVCLDEPPYLRKKEDPRYKGDRPERDPDDPFLMKAAQSKKLLIEMFTLLGVPIWGAKGFESDDLIGWATIRGRNRFQLITAASNDSDLYQLFSVPVFQVHRGKHGLFQREHFVRTCGDVTAAQWVEILAMTGTHNAVPGIAGVGPVTAAKLVHDRGNSVWAKHEALITANKRLIILPHPDFVPDDQFRIVEARYNERAFITFLSKLGVTLIPSMRSALSRISGGRS